MTASFVCCELARLYVFVPLFLEQHRDETIQEALQRTDFDHIAYVLNATKEHDESLADEIQSLRVEKGCTRDGQSPPQGTKHPHLELALIKLLVKT